MKRVLFITNIPVPYKIDFYNELGKIVDLTVIFEAKGASNQGIRFNWNLEKISNFKAVFLQEGDIKEKRVDKRIFRYIKKGNYEEIVLTSYSYLTEMALLLYLKFRKIPYYISSDGGFIKYDENKLKRRYKTFLVSDAKGYFSPSSSSDDYLQYYGAIKEKLHRYPFTSLIEADILKHSLSSVEKNTFKNKIGAAQKKVILGVGQFIHRKGWDLLMKAAKQLPNNIDIYIVGGEPTGEYQALKDALSLNQVHFEGFKTKEELVDYYKAADLFVLPTREDIWGLVVNEAMAYGVPVITTDRCVAGIEIVNDKNGKVIPADESDELYKAIIAFFDNEKLMTECGEACLTVIRDFTIEKMATSYSQILM